MSHEAPATFAPAPEAFTGWRVFVYGSVALFVIGATVTAVGYSAMMLGGWLIDRVGNALDTGGDW